MRMLAVVALALVAVAAAGVWGIGQFGGSPAPVAVVSVVNDGGDAPATPAAKPTQVAEAPKPVVRTAPAPAPTASATPTPEAAPSDAPSAAPAAKQSGAAAILKQLQPNTDEKIIAPQFAQNETAPPAQPAEEPATTAAPVTADAPPAAAARAAPRSAAARAAPVPEAGLDAQVKSRKVTYNRPPKVLALNKPIDISLVINATGDLRAADEALKDFKGEKVERDVDLSDFVAAELSGTGFDIALQTTSPRQKLSGKIANQWRWRVTPTELGDRTLTLTIYGYPAGAFDGEPIDSYKDEIKVEVQQLDAIVTWAKGVQPVFAVLAAMAGVASAAFAFLRFRNEKKAKAPPAA